jgi:hypothetical protein
VILSLTVSARAATAGVPCAQEWKEAQRALRAAHERLNAALNSKETRATAPRGANEEQGKGSDVSGPLAAAPGAAEDYGACGSGEEGGARLGGCRSRHAQRALMKICTVAVMVGGEEGGARLGAAHVFQLFIVHHFHFVLIFFQVRRRGVPRGPEARLLTGSG